MRRCSPEWHGVPTPEWKPSTNRLNRKQVTGLLGAMDTIRDWYHVLPGQTHGARFETATCEIEFWFQPAD